MVTDLSNLVFEHVFLGDAFSETATRYWAAVDDLSTATDRGDASIGLPPYNGRPVQQRADAAARQRPAR